MVRGDTTSPVVQIRRRVKARAEQIFDLWTQPDLMVRWMSPYPGAVDCKANCDLRPGGAFSLVMSSEESKREVSGIYVEVDRPRKLVFTWTGPLTNNANTLVTVELDPRGDENRPRTDPRASTDPGNSRRSYQRLGKYIGPSGGRGFEGPLGRTAFKRIKRSSSTMRSTGRFAAYAEPMRPVLYPLETPLACGTNVPEQQNICPVSYIYIFLFTRPTFALR
jgi:uncharacterized protein YndB with AHSA1/START domain